MLLGRRPERRAARVCPSHCLPRLACRGPLLARTGFTRPLDRLLYQLPAQHTLAACETHPGEPPTPPHPPPHTPMPPTTRSPSNIASQVPPVPPATPCTMRKHYTSPTIACNFPCPAFPRPLGAPPHPCRPRPPLPTTRPRMPARHQLLSGSSSAGSRPPSRGWRAASRQTGASPWPPPTQG